MRRIATEAATVALAVVAVHRLAHVDPVATLGSLYDDVVYLSLGKAIASGAGYRSIHLVGAPVHAKFPPGVPAIAALYWLVGKTLARTVAIAAAASLAATALAAAAIWAHARAVLRAPAIASLIAVVPLAGVRAVRYFSGAASEPWYMAAWAAALLLSARVRQPGARPRDAVALGLTLAAAMLLRAQGIALVVAVPLGLAISRVPTRRIALVALSTLAPLACWAVWHAAMLRAGATVSDPDQVAYSAWLAGGSATFFRVVASNAREYPPMVVDTLVGWHDARIVAAIAGVVALAVVGAAATWRRVPELVTSVGASCCVVLAWPFVQDRFLVALLPFVGLLAAAGATAIATAWASRSRWVGGAPLAALGGVALLVLRANFLALAASRGTLLSPLLARRGREVSAWVAARTAPGDRIMADVGGTIYLRTGRATSPAWPEQPTVGASIFADSGRYHAQRLLADRDDWLIAWRYTAARLEAELAPIRRRCPRLLTQVPPYAGLDDSLPTAYYRVSSDRTCLDAFLTERGWSAPPR